MLQLVCARASDTVCMLQPRRGENYAVDGVEGKWTRAYPTAQKNGQGAVSMTGIV
jgi:hypothetical protein